MPSEKRNLLWAALILLICCALFMGFNANDRWNFILPLRAAKLWALLVVAYAIGTSTLLFQTLTGNPILTPSVLGFDSLYIFLQTLLVAVLGSIGYAKLDIPFKFTAELIVMIGASLVLFQTLLIHSRHDLARMILIGVVFGIFFRSITGLMQRLINPEEFAVIQSISFASFNSINPKLLVIGSVISIISALFIWRERFRLDVHLLGRDQAINLGISYQKNMVWILILISTLEATATAMVGPVSFFGLLVCAITNHFSGDMKHCVRLPMTFLIGSILLIGGQIIFEHFLNMKAILSVVIEFFGGMIFLRLILSKKSV